MKMSFAASAIALMGLAVSGLAACGPGAPATDGATPAATAAPESAAAPAAAPASQGEGPAAGKWKMTTTAMGQAMPPSEVCYEKQISFEELDKQQKQQQPQQPNVTCTEQVYKKEGDAQVSHSVCTAEILGKPMTMTTDVRATGDFKTRYTMDMTVKMDPPPMKGMEEQKMTVVAERLGDCDPK
ncbi:MAG TPA: DUF3617 family protein [Hyphomonadaceae bacterium]|jgi:hypothetical protein|nr:DUF3617 family protein [Hyphomonadaceae bacterium]